MGLIGTCLLIDSFLEAATIKPDAIRLPRSLHDLGHIVYSVGKPHPLWDVKLVEFEYFFSGKLDRKRFSRPKK